MRGKACFILSLLLAFLVQPLAGEGTAMHSFLFPQVGDGVSGSTRHQTTFILVNIGEETVIRMELADSSGEPLELQLGDLGPAFSFEIPLGQGQAVSLTTPGEGGLKVGYARVTAPSYVTGTAIFTRSDASTGVLLYEAGVPAGVALQELTIFVDSLGDRETGVAFVNPALPGQPGENTVTLRLYDTLFNLLAEKTVLLAPGEHLARFIFELFPELEAEARDMQGVLTLVSDLPVVAVTLRSKESPEHPFPQSVPLLTAFPVVAGEAASPGRRFCTSFENGLEEWTATGIDLELAGSTIDWFIQPRHDQSTHGRIALRYFLSNLNDAGKIWIERAFRLERNHRYEVEVSFDFGSGDWGDFNHFNILAGATDRPPRAAEDLTVQEDTANGSDTDVALVWMQKRYRLQAETGPNGVLWVAVGVWGPWETPRTYYLDRLCVSFDPID